MNFVRAIVLFCLALQQSMLAAEARQYKVYPYNPKPFEKHLDISKEWNANRDQWQDKVQPMAVMKRQAELLETLSSREPKWIDGYWLTADANFQVGNSFKDPKDFPEAKTFFLKGKASAETCLKMQPANPLCKFYLGVNMGKIASIEGIFASLKNAKIVERLWLEVRDSPYDHRFSGRSTLQGADRYALGLFYRLVPDFFLMKWLFDVKGDISKSVAFHRENLELDGPNVCSKTMLAVSLICEGDSEFTSKSGKEGLKQLKEARSYPVTSALFASCAKDLDKLEANPKMACGYETSRQQETSEEDFKKQQKNSTGNAH